MWGTKTWHQVMWHLENEVNKNGKNNGVQINEKDTTSLDTKTQIWRILCVKEIEYIDMKIICAQNKSLVVEVEGVIGPQ